MGEDGFLGRRQTEEITPSLVREIIQRALAEGWELASHGDVLITFPERKDEEPSLSPGRPEKSISRP